jgi:hypothetical protein
MNIRIDCAIDGHDGEFVEYKPIRLKHRRAYFAGESDDMIWPALCASIAHWNITDEDGLVLPEATADTKLEDLDEVSDPMILWIFRSFVEALVEGRATAQSVPFSEPSS